MERRQRVCSISELADLFIRPPHRIEEILTYPYWFDKMEKQRPIGARLLKSFTFASMSISEWKQLRSMDSAYDDMMSLGYSKEQLDLMSLELQKAITDIRRQYVENTLQEVFDLEKAPAWDFYKPLGIPASLHPYDGFLRDSEDRFDSGNPQFLNLLSKRFQARLGKLRENSPETFIHETYREFTNNSTSPPNTI